MSAPDPWSTNEMLRHAGLPPINEDRPEPRPEMPTITHIHGPYSEGLTPMEEALRIVWNQARARLRRAETALAAAIVVIVGLVVYILTR